MSTDAELTARLTAIYLDAAEQAASEEEREGVLDAAAEAWRLIGEADNHQAALLAHLAEIEAEGLRPEPQTSAIAEGNLTVDVAAAIASGQIRTPEELAAVTDQADQAREAAKATRENALRAFGSMSMADVMAAQARANGPDEATRAAYEAWKQGHGALYGGASVENGK